MKEYKPFKSGKVRELYDLGDSLVMVCTDRISAFDNILKCPIPEKGCVLNLSPRIMCFLFVAQICVCANR